VANPFDDPDASYLALVNDEGQYSLWPAFAEVPAGWTVACPESDRADCLEFITERWTDMRPRSLIRIMEDRPSIAPAQERG
jgi:MbtH protein